jgi:hypothetical protein
LTTAAQPSPGGVLSVQLDPSLLQVTWSGGSQGVFSIGGRAADYRALARDGAALRLRYRVSARPQQPVRVGMICEAPYGPHPPPTDAVVAVDAAAAPPRNWALCGTASGAALDLTARLATARIGAWHTLSIPLACLVDQGADLSLVSAPFTVATGGALALSISDLRFVRHRAPSCP